MGKTEGTADCNTGKGVDQKYCMDDTHYSITGQESGTSENTTQAGPK